MKIPMFLKDRDFQAGIVITTIIIAVFILSVLGKEYAIYGVPLLIVGMFIVACGLGGRLR